MRTECVWWAWQSLRPGCLTGPWAKMEPVLGLIRSCHLLEMLNFEQGASPFHLALGPANDVADPVGRVRRIQASWLKSPLLLWVAAWHFSNKASSLLPGRKRQQSSKTRDPRPDFLILSVRIIGSDAFTLRGIPSWQNRMARLHLGNRSNALILHLMGCHGQRSVCLLAPLN